jgi:hypothetical protein
MLKAYISEEDRNALKKQKRDEYNEQRRLKRLQEKQS